MPSEREREIRKDKITQIDEFLRDVRPTGFWRNDMDNTPFMNFLGKFYRASKGASRYDYFADIIESRNSKSVRESIGTDQLFELNKDMSYAIEDIATEITNYAGNTIAYASQLLTRSYIMGTDKFRSKEEAFNEGGFYIEANVENKMRESDLAASLATLDGLESMANFEQEFSNVIAEDMLDIVSTLSESDPRRKSLLQVISMVEFGFNAIRILDKYSRIAKKLNPLAKEELQDIEDGYSVPDDWKTTTKDKSIEDTIDEIKDLVEDIYRGTETNIDEKGIEKLLYQASPGVVGIAKAIIDKKYPVTLQQRDASNLDTACQLMMGMPAKDNGFKNVSTQIAFNYILASAYPKDTMEDLAESYYDLIDPPKDCSYKSIKYELRDAIELGLDLEIGEIALWKLVAEEENYGLEYENYAREALCGNNPIISLKTIRKSLGNDDTDCREKDVTNILSGKSQHSYKTGVKGDMGSYIAAAYNNLTR